MCDQSFPVYHVKAKAPCDVHVYIETPEYTNKCKMPDSNKSSDLDKGKRAAIVVIFRNKKRKKLLYNVMIE